MHVSWKGLAASALVGASLVFGLQAPAGARSAAGVSAAVVTAPAALPNTNIARSGGTLLFVPSRLSAHWSGPLQNPLPPCTTARQGLTITNKTSRKETVTYRGSTFAVVSPGQRLGVCGWGSGRATVKLGLKGSTATLTIFFS